MEDTFIVRGGVPLKGEVALSGAKNVALKVLIASLLLDKPSTVMNVPHIADIDALISLVTKLGADVRFSKRNELFVDPKGMNVSEVDLVSGSKTRVSFMLFAPLLHRFGKARVPNPGGCRLGERPIDRHVDMMRSFGVSVEYDRTTGYYDAVLKDGRFTGSEYVFAKKTHTGTELALMIAAVADGVSTIGNVATEPEIDDLIEFLMMCGATIEKKGDSIQVTGVSSLIAPESPFRISADRNEAVTYAAFALATKGDITIRGLPADSIDYFMSVLRMAGGGVQEGENQFRVYYKGELVATDVTTLPHPGFMTDWQGPWAVVMTQAKGDSVIHETVFESRFGYVSELQKLGAEINYFQPEVENPEDLYQFNYPTVESERSEQAIRISGPMTLHNAVLAVSDLRAGATLLIGACVAPGESVVKGASVIDRGYETIVDKLRALGADIMRG